MDKVFDEILGRLEGHLSADRAAIASEIGALRAAVEGAEADRLREQRAERFLTALELRDSIIRNINEMRSLRYVPSRLRGAIVDGSLQALFQSNSHFAARRNLRPPLRGSAKTRIQKPVVEPLHQV